MSEERDYPITVIQQSLERHEGDAQAVKGLAWLADVVRLLKHETAVVPAPIEQVDTIPEYIYPH